MGSLNDFISVIQMTEGMKVGNEIEMIQHNPVITDDDFVIYMRYKGRGVNVAFVADDCVLVSYVYRNRDGDIVMRTTNYKYVSKSSVSYGYLGYMCKNTEIIGPYLTDYVASCETGNLCRDEKLIRDLIKLVKFHYDTRFTVGSNANNEVYVGMLNSLMRPNAKAATKI